jgi:hypothetical protein
MTAWAVRSVDSAPRIVAVLSSGTEHARLLEAAVLDAFTTARRAELFAAHARDDPVPLLA